MIPPQKCHLIKIHNTRDFCRKAMNNRMYTTGPESELRHKSHT